MFIIPLSFINITSTFKFIFPCYIYSLKITHYFSRTYTMSGAKDLAGNGASMAAALRKL